VRARPAPNNDATFLSGDKARDFGLLAAERPRISQISADLTHGRSGPGRPGGGLEVAL